MSGESKTTRDHDTIRKWAEERGGKPSRVQDTGVIQLDFPGYSGDRLEEISWDEWFEVFDDRGLEFLYQETTKDGEQSNFNKLVDPSND